MLTRVIFGLRYEIPVPYQLALIWVDIDPLYFRPACDIGLQCVPIASRFDFPELGSEQLLTADRTLIAGASRRPRSEEHTSELQSLMRISYAVFCLKKTTSDNNISVRVVRHSTRIKKNITN